MGVSVLFFVFVFLVVSCFCFLEHIFIDLSVSEETGNVLDLSEMYIEKK